MDTESRTFPAGGREAGIALLVVMVVFIILYLVVFQLHYTTRLEEKLSKARSADALGAAAIQSVGYTILGLLAEDYRKAASDSQGGTPSATGGGDGGERRSRGPLESSSGTDPSATAVPQEAAGAAGPTCHDYLQENIFLDNQQSLNGVTVKITNTDNERRFDLNQLWGYPPSQADTLSETNQEMADEAARSLPDTSDPLVNELLEQAGAKSRTKKGSQGSRSSRKAGSPGTPPGQAGGEATGEEGEAFDWVPPAEERRLEAVKMLERAIDMMYRLNTEYGFDYKVQPPLPRVLAEAIERYAYDRRSQPFQNYIHLPSELLNVLAMLGASPEVYYGPVPEILEGEEFIDRTESFIYQKDEFGDLVGEYLGAEDQSLERELMQEQVNELQSLYGHMYGQFIDFNRLGFTELGRMGSPLTRNMREFAEVEDEFGNVSLAVPPSPIGLKDLFTTFSTGKININTAPVPVLYALLPLIIETEPEGELRAQGVALNIEAYRNAFQPEYDETDPLSAERQAASAGAPHRRPPQEGDSASGRGSKKSVDQARDLLSASGAGAGGLTPEELAQAAAGESSDYETNYFTSLAQLKLIDGESGDRDDYLTESAAGTTTSTLAEKTPLQKVMHDYGKVMVFGSTYFTATLKSKAKDSPSVKIGYLTVVRDVRRKRLEVLQWKELQK